MPLFHFSEDPRIRVFEPRRKGSGNAQDEPLVWAIDDWHAPMYFVPRECPRACFWAGSRTTPRDRERWLNGLDPRLVMIVESGWLERIRAAQLFRYTLPEASFSALPHAGGHQVSRETVTPLAVEPVGDLLQALTGTGVELRLAARLGPLWQRVCQQSTLEFSGTRLRNALGYPAEFAVEVHADAALGDVEEVAGVEAQSLSLEVATPADQPLLANLLEFYVHDLSAAFPHVALGADGRFGYRALPLYWSEPERRFAFLIRQGQSVAGFVLATRGSPALADPEVLDVAEFFVLRRYRRSDVGRRAARLLWSRLPGKWTVRVAERNPSALAFWSRVSAGFTPGAVSEWQQPGQAGAWHVFCFETR